MRSTIQRRLTTSATSTPSSFMSVNRRYSHRASTVSCARQGTAIRRPTSYVEGLMYDIMRRGGVPRFRVIERFDDAIALFVSETNWAQRYIGQGYPLRNKWDEQRRPGEMT